MPKFYITTKDVWVVEADNEESAKEVFLGTEKPWDVFENVESEFEIEDAPDDA